MKLIKKARSTLFPKISSVRALFFLPILYCSLLPVGESLSAEPQWKEIKSEHFIVHFEKDEGFAKEVSRKSEMYYRKIASELGYQRYSGFWTWDNRVTIDIHPTLESFLAATNQPQWSQGVANYTTKSIASYALSKEFLDGLLPHELTHLIFRDYVGFKGDVPLWLDEGVAQWMEPKKRKAVQFVIKRLAREGKLFSLEQMMTLDIRTSNDNARVGVYYVQAVSLVSFLVNKYGTVRFTNFCRQLRDGKNVADALVFAYPRSLRSLEDLEIKWQKYIEEGNNGT